VAIVAIPSKKYGEEACAFVVLKDGAEADEGEIKSYVNKNLAKHKVPSHVLFTDSFPLTASGKIQKFLLRDKAIELLNLEKDATIETA